MKIKKIFFLFLFFWLFSIKAYSAIAFRSSALTSGSGTSIVANQPSGASLDDIYIAAIIMNSNASAQTTPAGWTQLYLANGTDADFGVYWVRRPAASPAMTFTWTGSVTTVRISVSAWVGAVTTGDPFNITGNSGISQANPANPDSPSVTTTVANTLVISLGMTWGMWNGGGGTIPTGYTNGTNTQFSHIGIAYKLKTAAGAEDPAAWGNAVPALADRLGFTLAMTPGPPSIALRDVRAENGTYSDGAGNFELPVTETGDFLILMLTTGSSISVTTPPGWTRTHFQTSVPGDERFSVLWTRNTGTVDPNITWSGGTSHFSYVIASFIDVASTGDPFDVTSGTEFISASTPNPDSPVVETTATGTMVISTGVTSKGWSGTGTPPLNYILGGAQDTVGIGMAYKHKGTAGAENPGAFSGSAGGGGYHISATIVLRPEGSANTYRKKRNLRND
jgi:hypothetical protein